MATGYTNLNCKLPAAREPCEGHDGLGRDTRVFLWGRSGIWMNHCTCLLACFLSLVLAIIRMWPRGALLS